MDKIAAQELSMLLNDKSVADLMTLRMELGSESEGRDAQDGSGEEEEEGDRVIEVETKPETRLRASTKGKGKGKAKRKASIEKVVQGTGKAKFYRTSTSTKVRC
jgi:hypothetical protein